MSYTCLIINYNKILCYQLLGFRLLLCVPALNFLFMILFSVAFFTWLWTKNLVFKPQSYLFPSIGSKWNAPVTKSHTLPEQTSNNSVIWWQRYHRKNVVWNILIVFIQGIQAYSYIRTIWNWHFYITFSISNHIQSDCISNYYQRTAKIII